MTRLFQNRLARKPAVSAKFPPQLDFLSLLCDNRAMTMTDEEVREARQRLAAYKVDLAIEDMALHPRDDAVIQHIIEQRMDPDEADDYILQHLISEGVIDPENIPDPDRKP